MITASSNCSRIDAVKASANQLKLQDTKPASSRDADSAQSNTVKSDLQTLEDSIKSGDAKKAELALSNARSDMRKLDTDAAAKAKAADQPEPGADGPGFRRFLAYA